MPKPAWQFILALALGAALLGCGGVGDDDRSSDDSATGTTPDSETESETESVTESDTESETEADNGTDELLRFTVTDRVEFQTSMGPFVVALFGEDAPITVTNFLSYVDEGFFDGLVFHRVIPDFMIQGGGYNAELEEKAGHAPIALEIVDGLSHLPGVISMARTFVPDSATSQFFICVADDSPLDGDYAAFGTTESGYAVVEAISKVETESVGMFDDVPVTAVVIESAVRL